MALAVFVAGTILTTAPSVAATFQWENSGSGAWFDPSNWDPAGTPGDSDTAVVNNGGTAEAAGAVAPTVAGLRVGGGAGNVSGTVTTATADVEILDTGSVTVGFASEAGASADGALSVGGSIVPIAPAPTFGTYSIGTAQGDGAKAIGTVLVGGDVVGAQGFVGTTGAGSDSTAEGSLTVGGDLTGLRLVGNAAPSSLNSAAKGTVTVTKGDLTLGTGIVAIGQAFGVGSTAIGAVSVDAGNFRTAPTIPTILSIGFARDGVAMGTLDAAGVDSTDAALASLVVGSTVSNGIAAGTLTLGKGDVRLAGNALIGSASVETGGSAYGLATLGGALVAEGDNRQLRVGNAVGDISQVSPGSATGVLSAEGLSGFRNVFVSFASGFAGLGPEAEGNLSVAAGGIANSTDPGGVLSIGRSEAQALNGQLTGPGPVTSGAATVDGDISGYDFVRIGTVANSGTATGSLALGSGALTTTGFAIGQVVPPGSGLSATNAVSTAVGLVEVNGGAVVVANPVPVFGGLTRIGEVLSGQGDGNSANGTLSLTNARFDSGGVTLGFGDGGDGTLLGTDSDIRVGFMQLGGSGGTVAGGTGRAILTDSTLTAAADPDRSFSGSLALGAGNTALMATNTDVAIDGTLAILRTGGSAIAGDIARMSMDGGKLEVGQNIQIGDFQPGTYGELSLASVAGTVGGNVNVGQSANFGTLFGSALLNLDGSLLDIAGEVLLDLGGELSFGIGGLGRGLGGYGAFDAMSTSLFGGAAKVDFTGLTGSLGFLSADFDLISAKKGFTGDFGLVSFLNIPTGYAASHGFTDDGDVWRVTLTRDLAPIPLPAGGWLLLSSLAGILIFRMRVS